MLSIVGEREGPCRVVVIVNECVGKGTVCVAGTLWPEGCVADYTRLICVSFTVYISEYLKPTARR